MARAEINSSLAKKLKEEYISGVSGVELAKRHGLNSVEVYTILKAYDVNIGYPPHNSPKRKKSIKKRNEEIKECYLSGMKLSNIGEKFGLSKSGIYAIVKSMGINSKDVAGLKRVTNTDEAFIRLIDSNKDVDIYKYMTPREEKIVKNRLEDYMTYEEIAKEFGLSMERIGQIYKRALKRAKKAIAIYKSKITREENKKKWLLELEKMKSEQKDKLPNKNEKASLISMPIEELDLDTRSYNCLIKHGINTIEDLITNTEDEIGSIRGLGILSLCRIKHKLSELGLPLLNSEVVSSEQSHVNGKDIADDDLDIFDDVFDVDDADAQEGSMRL